MKATNKAQRVLLPRGTVLDGRFEIEEMMGAGAFGAVYRARQLVFGQSLREVALKLFESEIVTAQNMRTIFNDAIAVIGMQEEKPDADVSRHIVQVFDIGLLRDQVPPRAFISMKLVSGGKTLESEVRRFRPDGMPVATSIDYLKQILVPLAWMHSLPSAVVHGDLKPDNILLSEKHELIVTDFGLAGRLPVGSLGGAIQYQAPESLFGVAAEAPADVYGLGLMWYEMLTGHHPFENVGLEAIGAGDDRAFLRAQQEARKWPIRAKSPEDDPVNPKSIQLASELNDELSQHPQVEQILTRCLTYEQSDRYPNARILLDDINRYLTKGAVSELGMPAVPKPSLTEPLLPPKGQPSALVADAKSLFEFGRYQDAIAKSEAALKLDPQHSAAHVMVIRSLSATNRINEAQKAWQRAGSLIPDNPELYEAAAEMFMAAKKPGMAQNMRTEAANIRRRPRRN